ncbi:MAG TPA: DUF1127 domain-containing protein [Burkholderiales bacterium]|nr:DUF1127 domain-containing protein [Burkholderiales bacterium]
MMKILNVVLDAFAEARRKRAQARLLQHLDERTLRDIGLEVEANYARNRARRVDVRFGMY